MTIKGSEISFLIEQFARSGWNELRLEVDGLRLYLSTNPLPSARGDARASTHSSGSVTASTTAQASLKDPRIVAAGPTAAPAAGATNVPSTWVAIKAPNLGTFYRSPKPGAPPFVEVGQPVVPQTEVCLLEVMKLFTAVQAGVSGVVRRICINDSDMVEHDQALMYVEPA